MNSKTYFTVLAVVAAFWLGVVAQKTKQDVTFHVSGYEVNVPTEAPSFWACRVTPHASLLVGISVECVDLRKFVENEATSVQHEAM